MRNTALVSTIPDRLIRILFLFGLVITTLCLLLYTAPKADAQQVNTRVMTIVPPSVSLSLAPGETAEGILKVVNDSDETLNFDTFIRDYIVEDNQGTPVILPPDSLSNKYSAAAWIGVSPTQFTVPGQSRQELSYFVQIPPNARPGGHYAAVMYQPVNVINLEGTGTGVLTHIGTLFYIHVKGDIAENAEVVKFDAPGFSEYGPVAIATEIRNLSDLHIRPKGTITVKNMFGQTIATQPLSEHNIFPERTFLYDNEFGQRWMIGRYTAELATNYGLNNDKTLTATVSFIVFPWKIAVICLLIIIILVLLFIALRKKKTRRTEQPEPPHDPSAHEQL